MKRLPAILATLVLMVSAATLADLCPKCKDQSYTKDIGTCTQCGGFTNSGQFKLCGKCSGTLNQCEHCRAALAASQPATAPAGKIDTSADGTYKSGLWAYRYSISGKGSRSEGYFGDLFHDGKAVPEPREINDHVLTPWGMMYWVGDPHPAFGAHHWMPNPSPSGKLGRLLADPSGKAQVAVFAQILRPDVNVGKRELADWVKAALEKEGVKDARINIDWFIVTPTPVVLEDSRHFGHAEISLGSATPDKSIVIETDSGKIELPYRNGATKLVKHTVSSSIASIDLYLAFRIEVSAPSAASAPAGK